MKDALYFGHAGNQGEAIAWGRELGAGMTDLAECEGDNTLRC